MLERARELLELAQHPDQWGDQRLPDIFAVWDWAEANNLVEIEAGLAGLVATQLLSQFARKYHPVWDTRLPALAAEAKAAGQWHNYAGFLEGCLVLADTSDQKRQLLEELCQLYAHLGNVQRQAWYLHRLAGLYLLTQDFERARSALLTGYQSSRDTGDNPILGHILLGLGDGLSAQGRYTDACRVVYQAKLVFDAINSIFYITARDHLANLALEHGVSRSQYESPESLDQLVQELLRPSDQP